MTTGNLSWTQAACRPADRHGKTGWHLGTWRHRDELGGSPGISPECRRSRLNNFPLADVASPALRRRSDFLGSRPESNGSHCQLAFSRQKSIAGGDEDSTHWNSKTSQSVAQIARLCSRPVLASRSRGTSPLIRDPRNHNAARILVGCLAPALLAVHHASVRIEVAYYFIREIGR